MKKMNFRFVCKSTLASVLALICLLFCVGCNGESAPAKEGYVFSHKGTEIAINQKAQPILDAFSNQLLNFESSPSCAFTGLDKVFTYADFEIQTYPKDGVDYVYMICLLNDLVATPEGVRIGDTKAKVTETYGTPTKETNTAIEYTKHDMFLEFLIFEGNVSSIRYWKAKAEN